MMVDGSDRSATDGRADTQDAGQAGVPLTLTLSYLSLIPKAVSQWSQWYNDLYGHSICRFATLLLLPLITATSFQLAWVLLDEPNEP